MTLNTGFANQTAIPANAFERQRYGLISHSTQQKNIVAERQRAAQAPAMPAQRQGAFEQTPNRLPSPNARPVASPERTDVYSDATGEPPRYATDSDLSFWDIIDMINPLHHLPIVGNIYRSVTRDTLDPVSRFAGGLLYGGPVGAISSGVSMLAEHVQKTPSTETMPHEAAAAYARQDNPWTTEKAAQSYGATHTQREIDGHNPVRGENPHHHAAQSYRFADNFAQAERRAINIARHDVNANREWYRAIHDDR